MASASNKENPKKKPWQVELDEYIRQGEPSRVQKAESWQTAIGLQQVDGLEVSEYLLDTAKLHVEGDIDTQGARKRIESYYEQRRSRGIVERQTEEADLVSQRIVELFHFKVQKLHFELHFGGTNHSHRDHAEPDCNSKGTRVTSGSVRAHGQIENHLAAGEGPPPKSR